MKTRREAAPGHGGAEAAIRSGWGNFPKISSRVFRFDRQELLADIVRDHDGLIPFGNGRSYGDSALGANGIDVRPHRFFLNFDRERGLLAVEAGVLLAEILELIVPQGWFLKVTPGTKLITIGGAIASDVHGKNHHIDGCFSESVLQMTLMLPDGSLVSCSREANPELFRATCGGMGLTGVILDAVIVLERIASSRIEQTTFKAACLEETFALFDAARDKRYSVAWIDCLAGGRALGRSVLMVGDFCRHGGHAYPSARHVAIPFYFPSLVMNAWTAKLFNALYYGKARKQPLCRDVSIDDFFYPLDAVGDWNRVYGRCGFAQYQFVLPKEASLRGLTEILKLLAATGRGSFLGVLKACGKANDNFLSFPMEGYSLALDFPLRPGLLALLEHLDQLVLRHGGRLYLTKDMRARQDVFAPGYPSIGDFRALRKEYGMCRKFASLQSARVGI